MKKILILALAVMPFVAFSQDKTTTGTAATPAKTSESKFAIENPEVIFVELISSSNSTGTQVIKADFGREIISSLTDKEVTKQLTELRTMSFPSMPDALNYMASLGYKFQQNYVTNDRDNKTETHFVFEKRMPRKPNAEGGVGKPRPDRPEGNRPPDTQVNPNEKTPTTKPGEKTPQPSKPADKKK
jgi:hypothetical protein